MHASFCRPFARGFASRINLPMKFPGNKKEAVDVDADEMALTQRDLSRYFCVASGSSALCSERFRRLLIYFRDRGLLCVPFSRSKFYGEIESNRIVGHANLPELDTLK